MAQAVAHEIMSKEFIAENFDMSRNKQDVLSYIAKAQVIKVRVEPDSDNRNPNLYVPLTRGVARRMVEEADSVEALFNKMNKVLILG